MLDWGAVKLTRRRHDAPSMARCPHRLVGTRHRIPFGERPCAKEAVVRRPQQMSADSEEIQYEAVHGKEPLRLHSGLEPAHLSLALSRRLMRDLSPVVLVLPRAVNDGRHYDTVRRGIAP